MSLIYSYESSQINGAVFEVYKRMGVGLAEKVYQEALALELKLRNIPFEREKLYRLHYKGTMLEAYYIADFVCYDKIIVELKAVSELLDIHKAQVRNYLALTGLELTSTTFICNPLAYSTLTISDGEWTRKNSAKGLKNRKFL